MACLSCQERAKLIQQGIRNAATGQSVRPQVQQFNQTVRADIAAIKARIQRPQGRGR